PITSLPFSAELDFSTEAGAFDYDGCPTFWYTFELEDATDVAFYSDNLGVHFEVFEGEIDIFDEDEAEDAYIADSHNLSVSLEEGAYTVVAYDCDDVGEAEIFIEEAAAPVASPITLPFDNGGERLSFTPDGGAFAYFGSPAFWYTFSLEDATEVIFWSDAGEDVYFNVFEDGSADIFTAEPDYYDAGTLTLGAGSYTVAVCDSGWAGSAQVFIGPEPEPVAATLPISGALVFSPTNTVVENGYLRTIKYTFSLEEETELLFYGTGDGGWDARFSLINVDDPASPVTVFSGEYSSYSMTVPAGDYELWLDDDGYDLDSGYGTYTAQVYVGVEPEPSSSDLGDILETPFNEELTFSPAEGAFYYGGCFAHWYTFTVDEDAEIRFASDNFGVYFYVFGGAVNETEIFNYVSSEHYIDSDSDMTLSLEAGTYTVVACDNNGVGSAQVSIEEFIGYWTDNRADSYAPGAKDEDNDVLTISTEEEFALFAHELRQEALDYEGEPGIYYYKELSFVSDYEGWTVILGADLDLSAHFWEPAPLPFLTFEGRGHTISGLAVADYVYGIPLSTDEGGSARVIAAGLFCSADRANIYDITLSAPQFELPQIFPLSPFVHVAVGPLAGVVQGVGIFDVTVTDPDVWFSAAMYPMPISTAFVGGVVGIVDKSDGNNIMGVPITCVNNAEVHGGTVSANAERLCYEGYMGEEGGFVYAGGIAGANFAGVILNAYVSNGTTVSVTGYEGSGKQIAKVAAGGIAGYTSAQVMPEMGTCLLNNLSRAQLVVTAKADTVYVGGVAGEVYNDSILSNLYIGPLTTTGGAVSASTRRGAFGVISNTADYTAANNFAFPTAAAANSAGVYATLNSDTPDTGALWMVADISITDSGLPAGIVLPLFKRWTASSTDPRLGDYYVSVAAPVWALNETITLTPPQIFALFDSVTYPHHLTGDEVLQWQISSNGTSGWSEFTATTATAALNGKYLRYYANDMAGNVSSSAPRRITITGLPSGGGGGGGGTTPANPSLIPVTDLTTAGAQDSITVENDAASVTLPSDMLTGLGLTGKNAELVIEAVDADDLSDDIKAKIGDRPVISVTLEIDGKQVSWSNPDAPVTVSIPYTPAAGEDPNSIVVWYIDGEGNAVCVPNGRYDPATGTVTFEVTHFSLYAVAYNKVGFTDVAAGQWYEDAVSFIAARGITTGTGDGSTYSPGVTLTRAEFLVLMMRAYGIAPDTNPTNNFADAGNTYYTGYLAAAKRLGITNGVGDNLYAPNRPITRQEMFTLLYNALDVIGKLPVGDSGKTLSSFTDASQIASWAQEAMALLVKTGTVGGSGGMLTPTSTTTRAEMAQVLYNLLGK
ncbi:MAG TPA: S-layer homology domain-containing protein, partial [Candidatus Acidoferrum sp.]|nr:S-layer homology domain-containing protein [Candidatus Acidoferrum sp.]